MSSEAQRPLASRLLAVGFVAALAMGGVAGLGGPAIADNTTTAVLDVVPADVAGCTVNDASLTWGFKESFRSYISGTIANGEWTVADGATYETPSFGFDGGTGEYGGASGGLVAFAGSINFTGHGGVLNTTVSNPQVRFAGDGTGVLLLDITGTTQEGQPVSATSVEFADLDLSGASVKDGQYTVTDAPATLTAEGATDFGTYPEGEPLDPVTMSFTVPPDCAVTAVTPSATVTPSPELENTSSESGLAWLWWILIGLALVAAAVVAVLVVRRRRAV